MHTIRFYIIFVFFLFLLDSAASCRIHQTKYACEYFRPCKWDSRGCVLGKRTLNSDSDLGYSIVDNFKPDLDYEVEKAKAHGD